MTKLVQALLKLSSLSVCELCLPASQSYLPLIQTDTILLCQDMVISNQSHQIIKIPEWTVVFLCFGQHQYLGFEVGEISAFSWPPQVNCEFLTQSFSEV